MSKIKIIKKERNMICGACHKTLNGITGKRVGCPACNGTGNIKDYHYIMTVGKFAYDMDTIK
jgi:DnaJ-class molecular chaperone